MRNVYDIYPDAIDILTEVCKAEADPRTKAHAMCGAMRVALKNVDAMDYNLADDEVYSSIKSLENLLADRFNSKQIPPLPEGVKTQEFHYHGADRVVFNVVIAGDKLKGVEYTKDGRYVGEPRSYFLDEINR